MPTPQKFKLSFFRENAKWAIGSVITGVVLFYLLLPFFWAPRLTNSILDRYAELSIRVGDSKSALEKINAKPVDTMSKDEITTMVFKSRKSETLSVKLVFNSRDKVIEASYPISLTEKVTLSDIATQLPESNSQEYWDEEGVNTKIRAYPEEGFAIRYHAATKSVYTLYQFVPNNLDTFLLRNPQFLSEEEYLEYEQEQESEPGFGSAFDLSVEIPNLDDPTATQSADIPLEEDLLSP